MEKHTTLAVDLAKSVYEVAVSEHPGRVAERYRLSRPALERFLAEQPAATVLMEACGSAHHWGRVARSLGHEPVLLPAHGVKPYVLRNKTDRSDARALLAAHRNADLFPVPVKTVAQQALTALHRTRSAWMTTRTACINLVRGLQREFVIPTPTGSTPVVPRTLELLHDSTSAVPHAIRPVLDNLCAEIRDLEPRIKRRSSRLSAMCSDSPPAGASRAISDSRRESGRAATSGGSDPSMFAPDDPMGSPSTRFAPGVAVTTYCQPARRQVRDSELRPKNQILGLRCHIDFAAFTRWNGEVTGRTRGVRKKPNRVRAMCRCQDRRGK